MRRKSVCSVPKIPPPTIVACATKDNQLDGSVRQGASVRHQVEVDRLEVFVANRAPRTRHPERTDRLVVGVPRHVSSIALKDDIEGDDVVGQVRLNLSFERGERRVMDVHRGVLTPRPHRRVRGRSACSPKRSSIARR